VFTSLPKLALIVVDEEHDASYKQQEGFRYSARDLAVMRARVPACPSSWAPPRPRWKPWKTRRRALLKHLLPQRPGARARRACRSSICASTRASRVLDSPRCRPSAQHLKAGGQVIVFLNRRGYAPSLFCNSLRLGRALRALRRAHDLHRRARQLRCHHCGAQRPGPGDLRPVRPALQPGGSGHRAGRGDACALFPDAPLARLDRDTASARGAMEAVLERVHSGEARILVGTQMLTKGHHFPDVSLVVILDADQGLFASDFRATERLAQTITQVAGRAGREARAGEV
jgi:primosomal protein N' (replication factor Y)